jgi:hypothetical protein
MVFARLLQVRPTRTWGCLHTLRVPCDRASEQVPVTGVLSTYQATFRVRGWRFHRVWRHPTAASLCGLTPAPAQSKTSGHSNDPQMPALSRHKPSHPGASYRRDAFDAQCAVYRSSVCGPDGPIRLAQFSSKELELGVG